MDRLSHPHTRDRLRQELRRDVPDLIWGRLLEKGYVNDAVHRDGWEILVEEARFLLGCMEEGARGRTPHRTPTASTGVPIAARGRALGAWTARYARGDMFTGLRNRGSWLEAARGYFGGVFGRDEAIAHLESDAWRLVPLPALVGRQPFEGLSPGDAPRIRGTTARVCSMFDETLDGASGVRVEIEVVFAQEVRTLSVRHPSRARFVSAYIPGREPVRAIAAEGTFNEHLWGIATLNRLAPMTDPEMLWFILTDEPPEIRPLTVDVRQELGPGARPRDIITLEAEPWVPVQAVAAAYHEVQAERLKRKNRPPRERSLELARFLAEEGWGVPIRQQMRTWNELHPEFAVDDPRNFQKEARRAKTLLFGAP